MHHTYMTKYHFIDDFASECHEHHHLPPTRAVVIYSSFRDLLRLKPPLKALPSLLVPGLVRYRHLVAQPRLVLHPLPLLGGHAELHNPQLLDLPPPRPLGHLLPVPELVEGDAHRVGAPPPPPPAFAFAAASASRFPRAYSSISHLS